MSFIDSTLSSIIGVKKPRMDKYDNYVPIRRMSIYGNLENSMNWETSCPKENSIIGIVDGINEIPHGLTTMILLLDVTFSCFI